MSERELWIGNTAYSIAERTDLLDKLRELRREVIEEYDKEKSPKFLKLYGGILRDLGRVMDKKEGLK